MLLKIKMHSLISRSQSSCGYLAGPEDSDSAPTAGNSLRARVAPWQELWERTGVGLRLLGCSQPL